MVTHCCVHIPLAGGADTTLVVAKVIHLLGVCCAVCVHKLQSMVPLDF